MKRAFVLIALLVVTACGGSSNPAGDEKAVKAAAQEQGDRFASNDYGGAWDMWVDSAKKVISRDDYVKFAKTCDLGGVPLKAEFARFDNKAKTKAIVRIGVGKFMSSYVMRLEDGDWSWVPSDEALKDYALGVAGAVAAAKTEGSCS